MRRGPGKICLVDHPTGGRAASHGHAHRRRHEGHRGFEWQWSRSDTPTPDGFVPIQGATSDTYTPVMSVEDDTVTTENEGVNGDEGKYLQADGQVPRQRVRREAGRRYYYRCGRIDD